MLRSGSVGPATQSRRGPVVFCAPADARGSVWPHGARPGSGGPLPR